MAPSCLFPRRLVVWLLSLALGAGCARPALAQAQVAPPGHPYVRTFKEPDGLPQMAIYALAPDRGGRLWAGTLAGVARFDGQRWSTLETPPSGYALMVNSNAMCGMSDGSMWIGTRFQGILQNQEGRWIVHNTASGLPSNNINAILESSSRDASGHPVVYAATYGKGLARFQDGAWSHVPGDLGEERLFCILERADGLWVGTAHGVWILDRQGRWRAYEGNAQLSDPLVRTLAETVEPGGAERTLWIGTEKGGLYRLRGGKLEAAPLKEKVCCSNVRALLAGPDGTLWVGTAGGGLASVKGDTWQVMNTRSGLITDFVRTLAITPGGPTGAALWAGTDGRGVMRIQPGGWNRLSIPWPVEDQRVQSFAETRDPATGEPVLWMGYTFLARLQGGKWTIFRPDQDSTADSMRSLFVFPGEQDLYFGHRQNLVCFSKGRFRFFGEKEGLPSSQIRALAGTRDEHGAKTLWIGSSRGLVVWDGVHFTPVPAPPGDPEFSVRSLALDGTRLWVGTDRGLACREGGAWVNPPALAAFPRVAIHAILPVPPRRPGDGPGLVVGTLGSGVHYLVDMNRPGEVQAYSTRSTWALHHDLVNDLVPGAAGELFVAGPRGVARLDPARGWTWDNFTEEDGLPATECIKGALFRDSRGRIWVGTEEGPAWFDPALRPMDRVSKPLVWEAAQFKGGPLLPGAELSHKTQDIHLEFRLLSGHREGDTRYRTRLEGLQDVPGDWVPGAFAHFTSLPPGRYALLVWARDYAGNESGPIRFPFRVLPSPWQRPWAWAIYLVLLGGGVWGLLTLRTRLLAQRNRELEERVRESTAEVLKQREDQEALNRELLQLNAEKNQFMGIAAHDLRNPLNTIVLVSDGLLSGDLEDCPPEILPWIRKVATSAHHMTSLINEFLDVNALDSGRALPAAAPVGVPELLASLAGQYQLRLEAKGQTLSIEGGTGALVHADPNHLRQVLDNLLSNASKFSPCGSAIRIRVAEGAGTTRFEVVDSGPGIPERDLAKLFLRFAKLSARPTGGESSSGLGLSIVKQLVDANHGRIWVENRSEGGCAFCVEMPALPPETPLGGNEKN